MNTYAGSNAEATQVSETGEQERKCVCAPNEESTEKGGEDADERLAFYSKRTHSIVREHIL